MKKIFIIITMLLASFTMISCDLNDTTILSTENYNIPFVFNNNTKWDLDTGAYSNNINFATTSREIVSTDTITLSNYTYANYILFWSASNQYLGYYCLRSTYETGVKYLDTVSSNTITLPDGARKIALMTNKNLTGGYYQTGEDTYLSYTYDDIFDNGLWEDYIIESIDDNVTVSGYTDYTYRDIFGDSQYSTGKTNLIDNGDFSDSDIYFSQHDTTVSIDNEALKIINHSGSVGYIGYDYNLDNYININIGHDYYISTDYKITTDISKISYISAAFDGTTGGTNQNFIVDSDLDDNYNVWVIGSNVMVAQNDFTGYITLKYYILPISPDINQIMYLDNIMLYDLTDIFGSGNEPTIEQFEEMLGEYERLSQFGDGEITLGDLGSFQSIIVNHANSQADYQMQVLINDTDLTYFTLENLIANGDFDIDSTTGFRLVGVSGDIENGILTVTNSEDRSYSYVAIDNQLITDNVFYQYGKLKTSSLNINKLWLLYYTGLADIPFDEVTSITLNEWYNLSGINKVDVTGYALKSIFYRANYNSLPDTTGDQYSLDNLILIDTTTDLYTDYVATLTDDDINTYALTLIADSDYNYFPDYNFTDDSNTDGLADGWNDGFVGFDDTIYYSDTLINESNTSGQYFKASNLTTGSHLIEYYYEGGYTVGEELILSFDITQLNDVGILPYIQYLDSTDTVINADDYGISDYIDETGTYYIKFTPTDKSTTDDRIRIAFVMYNLIGGGELSFTGSTQTATLNNIMLYDPEVVLQDNIKTYLDDVIDLYKYFEGEEYIIDINDSSFTDNYLYYSTDDINYIDQLVMYWIYDTDGEQYLDTPDSDHLQYLKDYWSDPYEEIEFTYGEYIEDDFTVLNPLQIEDVLNVNLWSTDTDRDAILSLFWDYINDIERYEWYTEYGVTSNMFEDLYEDYLYNVEETYNPNVSLFNSITAISSYNITIGEDDTFIEDLEDILDYATDGSTFIYKIVVFVIVVITLIGLALLRADFKIIIITVISELLFFIFIGWLSAWIGLLIGIVSIVLLVFMVKGREE